MKDEALAVWSESFRMRLYLLRFSGGIRGLFFAQFFGIGLIAAFLIFLLWLVAVVQGKNAASPQKILVILLVFDSVVTIVFCMLFLFVPKVTISSKSLQIGGFKWPNDAFKSIAWIKQVINGSERHILVLVTKKARRVAVVIPADKTKQQVEEILRRSGISK